MAVVLTAAMPAAAAPYMIVGMDQKLTWDDRGDKVLTASGHDLVAIVDLAKPEAPRVIATLPLENSIGGPPVNVAISPDDRLALVADSYTNVPKGSGFDQVPTNKLFVIDLTGGRPRVVQTLTVGSQPSGLSINRAGTLALVAYRDGHAVGVFRIARGRLREIGRVPLEGDISHVVFTPDGRHALAVHHDTNKVSVLDVAGEKVSLSGIQIPATEGVYNIDVSPDGRLAMTGDARFSTVIELSARPSRAIGKVAIPVGGEGLAISPRGDLAAIASLRGSNGPHNAPWFQKTGAVTIVRIAGTTVTPVKTIEVGRVPEAIGFSPDGRYLYVGDFLDNDFRILRVNGTDVVDTGKRLMLPGRPASARITPGPQPMRASK